MSISTPSGHLDLNYKELFDRKLFLDLLLKELINCPPQSLDMFPKQGGVGIYILYYSGNFEPYRKLVEKNKLQEWPIYVGSAAPGARKGASEDAISGYPLNSRLLEHQTSIKQVENLNIKNFLFKCIAFQDPIWVLTAEQILINYFNPIWNVEISGFGWRSRPGGLGNRKDTTRSLWDTLHPGREVAQNLIPNPITCSELQLLIDKCRLRPLEEIQRKLFEIPQHFGLPLGD